MEHHRTTSSSTQSWWWWFLWCLWQNLKPSCTTPMLHQLSVYRRHHHHCRCDNHHQHHNDDDFYDDYGKTWSSTNQGSMRLREILKKENYQRELFVVHVLSTSSSIRKECSLHNIHGIAISDAFRWSLLLEMVSFASILLSKFKFGKNSGLFTHSLLQKSENDKNLFFYRAMQNCIAAVSSKFCSTTQIPNSWWILRKRFLFNLLRRKQLSLLLLARIKTLINLLPQHFLQKKLSFRFCNTILMTSWWRWRWWRRWRRWW